MTDDELATNWSDETYRKMSVKLTFWGKNGRINVDRQEIQVYLRSLDEPFEDFKQGWNVRYTTELTQPVAFYVRGEEYSAQIDHFVQCILAGKEALSTFRSASDTTLIANMMLEDAAKPHTRVTPGIEREPAARETEVEPARARKRNFFGRLLSADET